MKFTQCTDSITHAPKEFFSAEEIAILDAGTPALRVMPHSKGGQIYKLDKGGLHYATITEMRLEQ